MSTIKINQLATGSVELTDLIITADAAGVATKNTVQDLADAINTTSDSLPTEGSTNSVTSDGIYDALISNLEQTSIAIPSNNLFNVDTLVDGQYISSATGNIETASGWGYSGFIDISSYDVGQEFTLSGARGRDGFAFSQDNSGSTSIAGSYTWGGFPLTVTKPTNGNYLYFALYNPSGQTFSNIMVNTGNVALPYETFDNGWEIKESALPSDKVAYITLGGEGEDSFINGLKSKRTILPFKDVKVKTSRVFNFKRDDIVDSIVRENCVDDVAPLHALNTTLLGNHSYLGYECVTNASHGKVEGDIGSIYSDGTNQYTLIAVTELDELWVMADVLGDVLAAPSTLTYVSGGVSSTNIAISSHDYRQAYPCSSDYSLDVYIDGIKKTEKTGTFYYDDNITFNETYNLIERADILTWYQTSYESGLNPTGDILIYNNISYRFDVDGNCTISGDYNFIGGVDLADIMTLQAIGVATLPKYYIPKTVEFTQSATTVNFSLIEDRDVLGSELINFDSAKLDSSTIPNDRWLQLNDDSTLGFAMGFLPVADAGANRAVNTSSKTAQIKSSNNKVYPRLVDKGLITTTVGEAYSYIAYRNVFAQENGSTANYPVRTSGDDFYFIDYHNTQSIKQFEMPLDFVGRQLEVVEQRNITCNTSIVASKLTVNVDCLSDYGYIVIKINK